MKTEITPSAPRYGGEEVSNDIVSDSGGSTSARIGGGFINHDQGAPMNHELRPEVVAGSGTASADIPPVECAGCGGRHHEVMYGSDGHDSWS
jgi:hypothetical protein